MKHLKHVISLAMPVFIAGCYQKHLVLRADAVSMTESHAGSTEALALGDEVEEKWCAGDTPVLDSEDAVYGLADQVIYKAQDGGKRADFITEVKVYRDSNGCALLTGRLAKK